MAAVTFIAFIPALRAGFVDWDDNRNFTGNPAFRGVGPAQLRWMWTTTLMGHYVPLTWMTLGLDYVLWGMNPAGYHLVNMLVHCLNAVLVFAIAVQLLRLVTPASDRRVYLAAALGALIFAVHPLRVESVAWITERRDVLSLMFCAVTVLCFLRWRDPSRPGTWYAASLVAFVCALLSKASSVTIPAAMFVMALYPLRWLDWGARFRDRESRRVLLKLFPFFGLSTITAIASVIVLKPPAQLSLASKLVLTAYSFCFYLWKSVVPTKLIPLYEMPPTIQLGQARFVVAMIAAALIAIGLWLARKRFPGLVAALAVFTIVIGPFLGLVQNGPQMVADRYTYHAGPALGVLAAGLVLRWFGRAAIIAASALIVVLATLTWHQTKIWHDSESLWTAVLRVDSTSSVAHVAMGDIRIRQERLTEALYHYQQGVRLDADYAEGYNNLGVILNRLGRPAEALPNYQRAVELKPVYAEARMNWGAALAQLGRDSAAIEQYAAALAADSSSAVAHVNWGNALTRLGRPQEAIAHYSQAVRIEPRNGEAYMNWGVALAQSRKYEEAATRFEAALAVAPHLTDAQRYLDQVRRLIGR